MLSNTWQGKESRASLSMALLSLQSRCTRVATMITRRFGPTERSEETTRTTLMPSWWLSLSGTLYISSCYICQLKMVTLVFFLSKVDKPDLFGNQRMENFAWSLHIIFNFNVLILYYLSELSFFSLQVPGVPSPDLVSLAMGGYT